MPETFTIPADSDKKPALTKLLGDPPPALRAFTSTLMGDRTPITETFFSPTELETLRATAEKRLAKGENVIGYGDYGEKDPWTTGTEGALQALTDPGKSLAFTLGMARVRKEADGTIVITDKYDFAASKKKVDDLKSQGTWAILKTLGEGLVQNGLLGVGNVLGNLAAPAGTGRNVEIRIPPADQTADATPVKAGDFNFGTNSGFEQLFPVLGQLGAKISDASWDRFVKEASAAKLDDRRGDPDPEFTQILREKANWDDLTDRQKDVVKRTAISELAAKMNTELSDYEANKNPDKTFSPKLMKKLPPELQVLAKEAGLDDLIKMIKKIPVKVEGK